MGSPKQKQVTKKKQQSSSKQLDFKNPYNTGIKEAGKTIRKGLNDYFNKEIEQKKSDNDTKVAKVKLDNATDIEKKNIDEETKKEIIRDVFNNHKEELDRSRDNFKNTYELLNKEKQEYIQHIKNSHEVLSKEKEQTYKETLDLTSKFIYSSTLLESYVKSNELIKDFVEYKAAYKQTINELLINIKHQKEKIYPIESKLKSLNLNIEKLKSNLEIEEKNFNKELIELKTILSLDIIEDLTERIKRHKIRLEEILTDIYSIKEKILAEELNRLNVYENFLHENELLISLQTQKSLSEKQYNNDEIGVLFQMSQGLVNSNKKEFISEKIIDVDIKQEEIKKLENY